MIDIFLLGCCTRFPCSLIKCCSRLAKITPFTLLSPLTGWMNWPINKFHVSNLNWPQIFTCHHIQRLARFFATNKQTDRQCSTLYYRYLFLHDRIILQNLMDKLSFNNFYFFRCIAMLFQWSMALYPAILAQYQDTSLYGLLYLGRYCFLTR